MKRLGVCRVSLALLVMLGAVANLRADPVPAAAASPAPAGGSAPATPAASGDAKFDASLKQVIQTLQDDQQRAALVDSLKKLQTAHQAANDGEESQAGGLLGAIAETFDALQDEVGDGRGPRQFWTRRLDRAGDELQRLVTVPPEPWGSALLRFVGALAFWSLTAVGTIWIITRIEKRLGVVNPPPPDAPTRRLLVFLLCRIAPWALSLAVAIDFARKRALETEPSIGRMLALILAYGWVSGFVFAALGVLLFSLFARGHRRPAVRVLVKQGPWLLIPAGGFGALGDAMRNPKVEHLLGINLSDTLSTLSNLLAALAIALFVLRFRRPVAHLLNNRSWVQRSTQRFLTQMLRLAGALWNLPILLLVTVSAAVTLLSPANSETALRRAIVTALLLVLAALVTALIARQAQLKPGTRRRSPYAPRFLTFAHTIGALLLWLLVTELVARIWDRSAAAFVHDNPLGHRIGVSLGAIGGTLLAGWFLWIVLDTAIQESIAPTHRIRGRGPSTRALTVLPLIRNALFIALMTLGVIVTLANLGVNVAPLLAGAGVVGLAVGFGAQTLVKDVITGVFILIEDTLTLGDWVSIDTKAGNVESLTIRTVRLRDGDGALHSIPFSSITTIRNHSRQFGYAIFNVRITYESDVDEAMRLMREAAEDVQRDAMLKRQIVAPLEIWGLDRFEAGAVVLQGRIKTRPQKQSDVARAFNRKLKERFDASRIVDFALGEQILRVRGALPSAAPGADPANSMPPSSAQSGGGEAPA